MLILGCVPPSWAGDGVLLDVRGHVEVVDGDTFWIVTPDRRVEIRPGGIDAPEMKQACRRDGQAFMAGIAARDWLRNYVRDRTVMCWPTGETSYRRLIADCLVDGKSLQDAIVRAGWAFDYARYSGGRYAAAEAEARAAGRGVWQGTCDTPSVWRRNNR